MNTLIGRAKQCIGKGEGEGEITSYVKQKKKDKGKEKNSSHLFPGINKISYAISNIQYKNIIVEILYSTSTLSHLKPKSKGKKSTARGLKIRNKGMPLNYQTSPTQGGG